MAHLLGGQVEKGDARRIRLRAARPRRVPTSCCAASPVHQQVWMSHRDLVAAPPPGFRRPGQHRDVPRRRHVRSGRKAVRRAVSPGSRAHALRPAASCRTFSSTSAAASRIGIPTGQIQALEDQIRAAAGDRNVFFFVSGGVDSTVAYTLCLKALGPERVHGAYVDTGLMREGETEFVRAQFRGSGRQRFPGGRRRAAVPRPRSNARSIPNRSATSSARNSSRCRSAFSKASTSSTASWILGQGTIYPDTIESGGTAKADLIKTHHNRVAGIQTLDRRGPHHRAAGVVLQGRSPRDRPRTGHRAGTARPPSLPRPRPRHPLPVSRPRRASPREPPTAGFCPFAPWACRAIRAPTARCWRSRISRHARGSRAPGESQRRRESGGGDDRGRSAAAKMQAHPGSSDRRAARPSAPRRRDRAPALARIGLRPADLAVPGGADSVRDRRIGRIPWCCGRSIRWMA